MDWQTQVQTNWRTRLAHINRQAKRRALRKNLHHSLTTDALIAKIVAQNYCCAGTGLPLHLACPLTGTTRNPWSPSLDRIDPNQGYTPANTQVVCLIYNFAKHDFPEEALQTLAEAIISV